MKDVVSPEAGVGDDLHEADTRVDEGHSRLADLTDYLWSITGFEAYYIALEDAAREDADSDEHEVCELYEHEEGHACSLSHADSEVEDDSVETVPDDQIEDWLDDQIEDWLDIIRGVSSSFDLRVLFAGF